jgi:hypothetical protein
MKINTPDDINYETLANEIKRFASRIGCQAYYDGDTEEVFIIHDSDPINNIVNFPASPNKPDDNGPSAA